MRQARKKTEDKSPLSGQIQRRTREGLFILVSAVALFMLISLITYQRNDTGWSHTGFSSITLNSGGLVGAWLSDVFLYLFGCLAFIYPVMLIYLGWLPMREREDKLCFDWGLFSIRALGFVLMLVSGCALASLQTVVHGLQLPYATGGVLGQVVSHALQPVFNETGAVLLLLALFLIGVTLLTGLSWLKVMDGVGFAVFYAAAKTASGTKLVTVGMYHHFRRWQERPKAERRSEPVIKKPVIKKPAEPQVPVPKPAAKKPTKSSPKISQPKPQPTGNTSFKTPIQESLPSLELLKPKEVSGVKRASNAELEQKSREVEEKLLEFGVTVDVVAVYPGPVITRYELQLAAGLKVSKISGLAKDLARSLSVVSVRVVEVIPGKSVIGLEIPNDHREIVSLSEVLTSKAFAQASSPLSMGLGNDIAGHPVVVDLAKMPHLLVAGTTGAGKSVGLNAMLLSILYKSTPEEIRMILIDPKMLELAVYDGIPHLLAPVVTDMKEAGNALRWCVAEMERRYKLMAALGVRNLAGFNTKVKEAKEKGKPIKDPFQQTDNNDVPPEQQTVEYLEPLPFIVVLVDEFADMMMVVGKKVEDLIARIAQKARAAGIHLILATQRPSVDVITGLIKANVPTRIAFQVSSRIDSRTILDQQGAEHLLGYGDMLYLAPGTGVPVRVHGAFVGDDEVHRVVADLKRDAAPNYIDAVLEGGSMEGESGGAGGEEDAEQDELYDQAVAMVIDTRKASISSVQRRFRIGYNRAARLIEAMEMAGVVSSMESNGSREVLVAKEAG